jgi:hypothetical protein
MRFFRINRNTMAGYKKISTIAALLALLAVAWNAAGMHTIDAHQLDKDNWMVAVDGFSRARLSGWRY